MFPYKQVVAPMLIGIRSRRGWSGFVDKWSGSVEDVRGSVEEMGRFVRNGIYLHRRGRSLDGRIKLGDFHLFA